MNFPALHCPPTENSRRLWLLVLMLTLTAARAEALFRPFMQCVAVFNEAPGADSVHEREERYDQSLVQWNILAQKHHKNVSPVRHKGPWRYGWIAQGESAIAMEMNRRNQQLKDLQATMPSVHQMLFESFLISSLPVVIGGVGVVMAHPSTAVTMTTLAGAVYGSRFLPEKMLRAGHLFLRSRHARRLMFDGKGLRNLSRRAWQETHVALRLTDTAVVRLSRHGAVLASDLADSLAMEYFPSTMRQKTGPCLLEPVTPQPMHQLHLAELLTTDGDQPVMIHLEQILDSPTTIPRCLEAANHS